MKRDFPYLDHRTMAQVTETANLVSLQRLRRLTPEESLSVVGSLTYVCRSLDDVMTVLRISGIPTREAA